MRECLGLDLAFLLDGVHVDAVPEPFAPAGRSEWNARVRRAVCDGTKEQQIQPSAHIRAQMQNAQSGDIGGETRQTKEDAVRHGEHLCNSLVRHATRSD
jgi:hypothetical protein